MSVSFSCDGHTALVHPLGEQDIATAGALRQVLLDDCRQASTVVIDFSRATFVDSTTLGVIVSAHKRVVARGGQLIGVNAPPQVEKVLALTGIDALLQMRDDLPPVTTSTPAAPQSSGTTVRT